MKVFLTGATGYIGSVVAEKLLQNGHQVIALARSENSVKKLQTLGIETVFGDLDDLSILTEAVKSVDAVIHSGFKQSKNGFLASLVNERKSVNALLEGIKNSNKPIIYTSGTGLLGDTGVIIFDENTADKIDINDSNITDKDEMTQAIHQRMSTENDVLDTNGVKGIVLRPPNVYGRSHGHSLITSIIGASKNIKSVPYAVFSADNLWSFVHVDDLADLYVLAIENSKGGELYYASGETGLKTKDIAKALSQSLGYEGKTSEVEMEELIQIFGGPFMAYFWSWNNQATNKKAIRILNWQLKHTEMLKEIAQQTD
jgi:nucleoside-diphosphate-sugar epimerase